MSQTPTDSYLQSLLAGSQMLGQARENVVSQQQIGLQQAELAQRQRAMQQEAMMQQNQLQAQRQMQSEEIRAQSENYAKLNESRERQQAMEIEAGRMRQQEQQEFLRQQAMMENQVMVGMQKLQLELQRVDQQILATADNAPELVEMRKKRRELKSRQLRLQQTLGSGAIMSQLATSGGDGAQAGGGAVGGAGLIGQRNLASTTKQQRLESFEAQIGQYTQGLELEYGNTVKAMNSGFETATLRAIRGEDFMSQIERMTDAAALQQARGEMPLATSGLGVSILILADNFRQWALGSGSPEMAQTKTGEFLKNGSAMAVDIAHSAFSDYGHTLGLEPGNKQAAAAIVADIVSKAAVIANVDPRSRGIGAGQTKELRQQIAEGIGKLRQTGMNDAQLEGFLDGLAGIGGNRAELLASYTEKESLSDPQVAIIDSTLSKVSLIHDVLAGVADDAELMAPVGGTVQEMSKFNMAEVYRRGSLAYGAAESPEMVELAQMLRGMPQDERMQVLRTLTDQVPGLENMRPEDIDALIQSTSAQSTDLAMEMEALAEDERMRQAQIVGAGRARAFGKAQDDLDLLLAESGGMQ